MACTTHEAHQHQHGEACGHIRVQWLDKEAYLHDGHLHQSHGGHWDEAAIDVSANNPVTCQQVSCKDDHASLPMVPHGDHMDRVVDGHLHHMHGGHCDDHGPVTVKA